MANADRAIPLAFIRRSSGLLQFWSDIETFVLERRLPQVSRSPIFVCGLARSGTTIVTHILNAHAHTGSFLYRDLPFVEVPYFWSLINRLYYGHPRPQRREHGDHIVISPDAPDAFEELLWKRHLPRYDEGGFQTVLGEEYHDETFEERWRVAMRKVLFVRGGKRRYLAKGNYNLFRLRYILRVFPDAKIILCVREPFAHARSLARVHAAFSEMAKHDRTFAQRLALLGHFEFGPQRKAIRLNQDGYDGTLAHWERGEEYSGYLLQWRDVYSFARDAYPASANIHWFDCAAFARDKTEAVRSLLRFCALPEDELDLQSLGSSVEGPTSYDAVASPYDAEVCELYRSVCECRASAAS